MDCPNADKGRHRFPAGVTKGDACYCGERRMTRNKVAARTYRNLDGPSVAGYEPSVRARRAANIVDVPWDPDEVAKVIRREKPE